MHTPEWYLSETASFTLHHTSHATHARHGQAQHQCRLLPQEAVQRDSTCNKDTMRSERVCRFAVNGPAVFRWVSGRRKHRRHAQGRHGGWRRVRRCKVQSDGHMSTNENISTVSNRSLSAVICVGWCIAAKGRTSTGHMHMAAVACAFLRWPRGCTHTAPIRNGAALAQRLQPQSLALGCGRTAIACNLQPIERRELRVTAAAADRRLRVETTACRRLAVQSIPPHAV